MVERQEPAAEEKIYFEHHVPLAQLCTLEVGGPARRMVRCADEQQAVAALAQARRRGWPTFVLGGGSNVLASDDGFDGLVLQFGDTSIKIEAASPDHQQLDQQPPDQRQPRELMTVGAGAVWDHVVTAAVEAGLGGIECLAGIPGLAGAAPIQNIGAYGQEIAETLRRVWVIDRRDGSRRVLDAEECGFAYRWSHFKGPWRDRFLVTRLELLLPRTDLGTVRYGELKRRFEADGDTETPTPAEVRRAVLELRRAKSMLLEGNSSDVNRRSAGSFFLNPVVSSEVADRVEEKARLRGVARDLPRFPAPGGVKLPAAWLIEEAGFHRGFGDGAAGLSNRHTLALINRGGAQAEDLVELARQLRRGVYEAFGVELEPEPVFLGFDRTVRELLA